MVCKKWEWTANKYFQLIETNFIRFAITFLYMWWASEKCCLDSFTGWQTLLLTWKKHIYGFIFMSNLYLDHVKLRRSSPLQPVLSVQVLYLLYLLYCSRICRKCQQSNLYTAFCLFICFTRTSGVLSSWNNRNNLHAN